LKRFFIHFYRYVLKVEYRCPQPVKPSGCKSWTRNIPGFLRHSFNVENLAPYSIYHVTLIVYNQVGSAVSPTVTQTTLPEGNRLSHYSFIIIRLIYYSAWRSLHTIFIRIILHSLENFAFKIRGHRALHHV